MHLFYVSTDRESDELAMSGKRLALCNSRMFKHCHMPKVWITPIIEIIMKTIKPNSKLHIWHALVWLLLQAYNVFNVAFTFIEGNKLGKVYPKTLAIVQFHLVWKFRRKPHARGKPLILNEALVPVFSNKEHTKR